MNYPVWDLAMGGGVLMAVVSILHVFVSHFAVGGGLWLVITEHQALRRGDADLRAFVKSQSRFFILITLVFGAVSGVGIWFTAALISPHTITALIRAYVWGWAMEWVFFFVEIAAALVYWYGWEKLDRRTHLIVGWIYFIAAFMSLLIINGIITFMATPGGWLADREFWTGFFNPTYWPSVAIRTAAAVAQAGFFTLLTAAWLKRGGARDWSVRWSAGWVLVGMAGFALSGLWYDAALARALPDWRLLAAGALPVLPRVIALTQIGVVAAFILALFPLTKPRAWNSLGGGVLLMAGLLVFAGGEWTREAARKPYTIHGYLYSTGMLVADEAAYAAGEAVPETRWRDPAADTPEARGHDLYRAWCQPCHTLDGYNALRPALAFWSEEQIAEFLPRLQFLRFRMPAWYGSEQDVADLAAHLARIGADGNAAFPDDPQEAGRLAFDRFCGLCHTLDGEMELRSTLTGLGTDEIEELLDTLQDYGDSMPAYLAEEPQRGHLIRFLGDAARATDSTADDEGSDS
jgi:mono/diheme cytochrome c family protein